MKQNIQFAALIFILLATLFITGCNTEPHCPEVVTYKYDLSDAQKKLLKYTVKDTITFITNTGDTNILKVDSIFDYYEEFEGTGNDPACPQPIRAYQVQQFSFGLIHGGLNMEIKFFKDLGSQWDCTKTKFSDQTFYIPVRFLNNKQTSYYLEEKTFFNSKVYYNVTAVLNNWGQIKGDTLYFDNTYKVIGARIGNIEYVIVE